MQRGVLLFVFYENKGGNNIFISNDIFKTKKTLKLIKPRKYKFLKSFLLRGNSLYLVVFVSFILSVFLLLLISKSYYTQIEILRYQNLKQLIDINNNTIIKQITASDENLFKTEDNNSTGPLNDLHVSPYVLKWGGYTLSGVKSSWKNVFYEKTALAGNRLFDHEKTGLYLADQGKYLSIAGDTKLSGTCYIPALGIRSVYIDGEAYRGGELIHGTEKTSKEKLPRLNEGLIEWMSKAYSGNYGMKDTLISADKLLDEKLNRGFNKTTFVIEQNNILQIDDISLSGKIIIRSDTLIILKKSCFCSDIIVIAPRIIVESGFQGNLQLFASDSVLIEKDVDLFYPSFVSVYNTSSRKAFCYISEGALIQGGVLCGGESEGDNNAGELYISDDVEIHGLVYCNGRTKITGKVYGSLYTNMFVLKTDRGYYENHLLNAVVNPTEQYENLVVPEIFKSDRKDIIQWF